MIIEVDGKNYSSAQIKAGNFESNDLSDDSMYILSFISDWLNQKQQFSFHSSGSTGKPKKIDLSREVLAYSAQQTLNYLGLNGHSTKNMLLCLSPKVIGGTMLILRALIVDADVKVVAPNSNFQELSEGYDLASMVPIQLKKMVTSQPMALNRFRNILIGGAALDPSIEDSLRGLKPNFFHTYGMTETASHVAIRRLHEENYHTLGDIVLGLDEGRLKLKGTVTGGNWLQTNDLVEITSERSFRWLGRSDFIINTGGIKVNPEKIEQLLADQIKGIFAVSAQPDSQLGERIVLVAESSEIPISLEDIPQYHRPKAFLWNYTIPKTESGKIARSKLKASLSNV